MEDISLLRGWKFCFGDIKRWERVNHDICYETTKAGQEIGDMDCFFANPWVDVTIPHDWNTMQASEPRNHPSNGFKPRGIAWYYKKFDLPELDENTCVTLDFEGVMGESVVYVNGVLAARNESGYTGFAFDISDYIVPGENLIAVSVDNNRWEGWWYEGAGIYRPVTVHIRPAVHFARYGIFAKPVFDGKNWTVEISADVENTGEAKSKCSAKFEIADKNGKTVAKIDGKCEINAFSNEKICVKTAISSPELWSPERPYLYRMNCCLIGTGQEEQTETICFGFRDIRWTDHGMFINGVKTEVRGVCCHQDHVGIGIALNRSIIRYRIEKLKKMGCNAYRCAHNCPSKYLLDVCDELGMLVMVENRHFRSSEEVLKQIDELALVSRNHPSVFLYSLFNEEHVWQDEIRGFRVTKRLVRRLRESDDSRPITAAMNGGTLTEKNASDALDVAGMNYSLQDYPAYAVRRPGHPVVGTENGPIYATRGVYENNAELQQYDAFGLNYAPFGNNLADTMKAERSADHVAGVFVWGGFEYRGEPQPFEWPSVFSHWGLHDNCGFEKDTFYYLKSFYSEPNEPVLHLCPHWNHKPGESVKVVAMTNLDRVQLYLNDKLIGEKKVNDNYAEWTVPYEVGELKAEGTVDGKTVIDIVRTVGNPIRLDVVDAAAKTDYDCSIINVAVTDANGNIAPLSETDRDVTIEVVRGKLVGAGNGDPNGIQPDITETIHTFHGLCQFLVIPDDDGVMEVVLHSEEFQDKKISNR